MKLSEAWVLYEADKKLDGYSPYTMEQYVLQIRMLVRYFGDRSISEITTADLKQYLLERGGHLQPASLAHRIRFMKSLFRWAHEEGHITKNPAARIREPKQGTRIPRSMSEEDIEFMRNACTNTFDRTLIEILYATGCRIGEIYKLNRDSINWDKCSFIVIGKNNKEREVYFDNRCAIWLRKYLKSRTDDDVALFVTERAPHRMSIARLRERLKEVAERAGIKDSVYPHRLRHSYAMHLLDNGAPMEFIQELLGHSKLETTRIYAQLSGERRRELYRRYR